MSRLVPRVIKIKVAFRNFTKSPKQEEQRCKLSEYLRMCQLLKKDLSCEVSYRDQHRIKSKLGPYMKCNSGGTNLMHGVSKEGFQAAPLARRFVLQPRQQGCERSGLLAFGEHLQTVMVIAHVLLIDTEHRQQHVEQVPCTSQTQNITF